jgi:hypothetical protein
MKRPVWLLSMDSYQFHSAPTTTATLKAYYQRHGKRSESQQITLIHFRDAEEIVNWQEVWRKELLPVAQQAIEQNLQPVVGLSFYTWNAAEFLALTTFLKESLPQLLVIAGGPHVQQAEDYLGQDPIDLIFLGEGERTFTELLDGTGDNFGEIAGLAFLGSDGAIIKTANRERIRDLSEIPSPLEAMALQDSEGKPLYPSICYETSRGCPFQCAFCEWGTGAIGTAMNQFPLERIRRDWRTIVEAGIENIWLADSNFGALREDLEKTRLVCDLKKEFGLPKSFATSWSKKHSPRVQEMVLLLNRNGLLPHYQLALQTLTPLALELSNRKNMDANQYEPIAREMARAGVPIAAELIWGLPGDNLADFERNLDKLLATFPNVNIFGYTLLPGTEFYRRREEYRIESIPVAGYGKAKGEYVIGCHTFPREEGINGYFLITAHIILIHGHLLPLTARFFALEKSCSVSALLCQVLEALVNLVRPALPGIDLGNGILIYENRAAIYLALLADPECTYRIIREGVMAWLEQQNVSPSVVDKTGKHLQLDRVFAPRTGKKGTATYHFSFGATAITEKLEAMELPEESLYHTLDTITVETPGGVGDILKDPDGGGWLKGNLVRQKEEIVRVG